jgi:glycylpeptide N-tetradecanoyltransferase
MKYFIYITLLTIIIYYLFIKNNHIFWDSQPVSRKSILFNYKEGLIEKPKNININTNLDKDYQWSKITNITLFKKFLQKNYSKYELYSNDYLNWILNTPYDHIFKLDIKNRNKLNIALLYKNRLVGTITGKPVILKIKNNIIEGFYVDFLCIDKKHRNKKLAPKLISKILSIWKKYNLDAHIFKIDTKPLPFDHIGCYNYYYYDMKTKSNILLPNVNIKELTIKELEDAYNFFYSHINKYSLYQIMTLEEFKYNFLPNNFIKTYIIFNNENKINGFISVILMNYKHPYQKNKVAKCIELSYFFVDNPYYIFNILDKFTNYDYLIFVNMMEHHKLLDILETDVNKGHNTYYHLYNYITDLKPNEIGLNIV